MIPTYSVPYSVLQCHTVSIVLYTTQEITYDTDSLASIIEIYTVFYYLCFNRCNDDVIHLNCLRVALMTVISKLWCTSESAGKLVKTRMLRLPTIPPMKSECLEIFF